MIKNYKIYLNTFFIILIIIFLLNSKLLSNFVWTASSLFIDFKIPLEWLRCHSLGVNLLTLEALNCGDRNVSQFNYGQAFLHLPYNDLLDNFYRNYLPWILIFSFIFFSVKIIQLNNFTHYLLLYLALLNPSTMLLLERMQIDCIFYLAIIFCAYNRYYILNWILGIYFALIKFYPISILLTIFVENKERSLKSVLYIILLLSVIFFGYLLINKDSYWFTLNHMLPGKAGYHFLYSLNSFPKILKYLFGIKYQILLLIFYSLFIFSVIKIFKRLILNQDIYRDTLYSKESKLFFISGYFNLFLFILVSSYAYKEIYLILSIPFILLLNFKYNLKIAKFIIYLLIARYSYLFIYAFLNVHDGINFVNSVRVFSNYFIFAISVKALLDFILLSILISMLAIKTRLYLMSIFKNKKLV